MTKAPDGRDVRVAESDGKMGVCFYCSLGGSLLLCESDTCPVSAHAGCVGMRKEPEAPWYCYWCCPDFCEVQFVYTDRKHRLMYKLKWIKTGRVVNVPGSEVPSEALKSFYAKSKRTRRSQNKR